MRVTLRNLDVKDSGQDAGEVAEEGGVGHHNLGNDIFENDDDGFCDKCGIDDKDDDLYDEKFNPHGLAHGNNEAKEGLGFLLPDFHFTVIFQ